MSGFLLLSPSLLLSRLLITVIHSNGWMLLNAVFSCSFWRSALEADASTIASIFGFIANVTSIILLNFTALIQGIKDRTDFQHFYNTGVGILDTKRCSIANASVVNYAQTAESKGEKKKNIMRRTNPQILLLAISVWWFWHRKAHSIHVILISMILDFGCKHICRKPKILCFRAIIEKPARQLSTLKRWTRNHEHLIGIMIIIMQCNATHKWSLK